MLTVKHYDINDDSWKGSCTLLVGAQQMWQARV